MKWIRKDNWYIAGNVRTAWLWVEDWKTEDGFDLSSRFQIIYGPGVADGYSYRLFDRQIKVVYLERTLKDAQEMALEILEFEAEEEFGLV